MVDFPNRKTSYAKSAGVQVLVKNAEVLHFIKKILQESIYRLF